MKLSWVCSVLFRGEGDISKPEIGGEILWATQKIKKLDRYCGGWSAAGTWERGQLGGPLQHGWGGAGAAPEPPVLPVLQGV